MKDDQQARSGKSGKSVILDITDYKEIDENNIDNKGIPMAIQETDNTDTMEMTRFIAEKTAELEQLLSKYQSQVISTRAEMTAIIASDLAIRRIITEIFKSLDVTLERAEELDGKRTLMKYIFSTEERYSVESYTAGLIQVISTYKRAVNRTVELENQLRDSEKDNARLRAQIEALKAPPKEETTKTLPGDDDEETELAYVFAHNKLRNKFIGSENGTDPTPLKVKQFGKVTKEHAFRFASPEEAEKFMRRIKKNAKLLDKDKGLTEKFLDNYELKMA